ncbi:hypothetical protein [uncultured Nonlabens sp.]|nr:hypothetical protein [uncultured Nonlabens sp.]
MLFNIKELDRVEVLDVLDNEAMFHTRSVIYFSYQKLNYPVEVSMMV